MKNILIPLFFIISCSLLKGQVVQIDPSITAPSGCVNEAELVAHEINVLNIDSSIAAFAYVDLLSAFAYSSDQAIITTNFDGSFEIEDATYTFYRTRVAQTCKIDCCNKVVKWSDWIYSGSVINPQITAVNDTIQTSEVGTASPVDVTLNDTSTDCEPITYAVSNEINVTVVNNNDGTFDATPIAVGAWSFNYTATCSDGLTNGTAIVSGDAVGIPIITAVNDTIQTSEAGIVSPIDVTLNDTSSYCEPITYTVSNEVNVTVISNNDGTFDATPISAGAWSFDYTATCSDGITSDMATVSGEAITLLLITQSDWTQPTSTNSLTSTTFTANGCDGNSFTSTDEVIHEIVIPTIGTFNATFNYGDDLSSDTPISESGTLYWSDLQPFITSGSLAGQNLEIDKKAYWESLTGYGDFKVDSDLAYNPVTWLSTLYGTDSSCGSSGQSLDKPIETVILYDAQNFSNIGGTNFGINTCCNWTFSAFPTTIPSISYSIWYDGVLETNGVDYIADGINQPGTVNPLDCTGLTAIRVRAEFGGSFFHYVEEKEHIDVDASTCEGGVGTSGHIDSSVFTKYVGFDFVLRWRLFTFVNAASGVQNEFISGSYNVYNANNGLSVGGGALPGAVFPIIGDTGFNTYNFTFPGYGRYELETLGELDVTPGENYWQKTTVVIYGF